jgi:hypothetical protein
MPAGIQVCYSYSLQLSTRITQPRIEGGIRFSLASSTINMAPTDEIGRDWASNFSSIALGERRVKR